MRRESQLQPHHGCPATHFLTFYSRLNRIAIGRNGPTISDGTKGIAPRRRTVGGNIARALGSKIAAPPLAGWGPEAIRFRIEEWCRYILGSRRTPVESRFSSVLSNPPHFHPPFIKATTRGSIVGSGTTGNTPLPTRFHLLFSTNVLPLSLSLSLSLSRARATIYQSFDSSGEFRAFERERGRKERYLSNISSPVTFI